MDFESRRGVRSVALRVLFTLALAWALLLLGVTTVVVGVALLVGSIAVTLILDPPRPRPEDVQYIPLVFWLAPGATAALAPVAGVLVSWVRLVRKSAHSGGCT